MKMWKTYIDAVIMDKSGEHIINTTTQTFVPANSRGEAILVALDMGQAMARSTNTLNGINLFFRVVNVEETDQGIA